MLMQPSGYEYKTHTSSKSAFEQMMHEVNSSDRHVLEFVSFFPPTDTVVGVPVQSYHYYAWASSEDEYPSPAAASPFAPTVAESKVSSRCVGAIMHTTIYVYGAKNMDV